MNGVSDHSELLFPEPLFPNSPSKPEEHNREVIKKIETIQNNCKELLRENFGRRTVQPLIDKFDKEFSNKFKEIRKDLEKTSANKLRKGERLTKDDAEKYTKSVRDYVIKYFKFNEKTANKYVKEAVNLDLYGETATNLMPSKSLNHKQQIALSNTLSEMHAKLKKVDDFSVSNVLKDIISGLDLNPHFKSIGLSKEEQAIFSDKLEKIGTTWIHDITRDKQIKTLFPDFPLDKHQKRDLHAILDRFEEKIKGLAPQARLTETIPYFMGEMLDYTKSFKDEYGLQDPNKINEFFQHLRNFANDWVQEK